MKKETKTQKFIRVRNEVRASKLRNYSEYEAMRNQTGWPSRPEREFARSGWKGWIDYLGCETKSETFSRIKKEVRKANIANYTEYEAVRVANDWPSRPERDFLDFGWKGWPNFLGRKLRKIKTRFTEDSLIPFDVLRKKVKRMKIQRFEDYQKEAKKHPNWPSTPAVYPEYTAFEDFAQVPSRFIPLKQLKKEVRKFGIVFKKDYATIRKLHNFLHWPTDPSKQYSGWKNWSDLVGKKVSEAIKKADILPYEVLKYFVQKAGIKSYQQYEQERKKQKGWVSNPYRHFSKTGEWESYPDFWGN